MLKLNPKACKMLFPSFESFVHVCSLITIIVELWYIDKYIDIDKLRNPVSSFAIITAGLARWFSFRLTHLTIWAVISDSKLIDNHHCDLWINSCVWRYPVSSFANITAGRTAGTFYQRKWPSQCQWDSPVVGLSKSLPLPLGTFLAESPAISEDQRGLFSGP